MKARLKRKIFYIPGFDPRSEAYYKKLLFTQFPEIKQSQSNVHESGVSFATDKLDVNYEILSWHKAVKAYWSSGFWGNLKNIKTIFSDYVFQGTWKRLFKLSRRDGLQKAFSPYFFFLWLLLNCFGLIFIVYSYFNEENGSVLFFVELLILMLVNVLLYMGLNKLNLFWVNRIMNFFVLHSKKLDPLVKESEINFKKQILTALNSDNFDEVVVVAHSVGSILCLDIMTELAEEKKGEGLVIITLGHCVSGVSILPEAGWFNERLKLVERRKFQWIDVTAGKDAVTFYKVTPAYHSYILPDLTLSAGFHRVFTKDFYQATKWDFYKIHFLYIYNPHFPENSEFNYQKLLFDPQLFQNLKKATL
jgi:hypothetical protein